jgi:hypothetical protein
MTQIKPKMVSMRALALGFALMLATTAAGCDRTTEAETTGGSETMTQAHNPELVTLSGVVIQKQAAKNAESWMAGGGDYFVLDVGDAEVADRSAEEGVILQPSEAVTREQLEAAIGNLVEVEGEYVEGEPYEPENPMESYPTDMEGNPLPRGGGFKVYTLTVMD